MNYYKGSSNISLKLVKHGDDIDLVTDYREIITSVQDRVWVDACIARFS